ncbi:MAG: nucleotidyltransferase family protein [Bacteroidia bacterium]|nr:nucleotidyltransferase family protein [Bacteroidia bacterium]
MKAMILAAGLGTRMQPITLTRPKALVEVKGKTMLQRNIEYLKAAGVTEIVVNVHHFVEQIIEFIRSNNDFGVRIHISDETDAVLETGGGLKRAQSFLEEEQAFILMNVDILTDLSLTDMMAFHQNQADALATLAVTQRDSSRLLLFNPENQLKGWKNEKTGEKIILNADESCLVSRAFSGIHILSSRIFSHMKSEGKYSIINTYLELAEKFPIYGYDHSEGIFLDVGRPEVITVAENLIE